MIMADARHRGLRPQIRSPWPAPQRGPSADHWVECPDL